MVFQLSPPVDQVSFFTTAMRSVITDDSFSVPSPANKKAVETASALILWSDCPDNSKHLCVFSRILSVRLRACFSKKHTSLRLRKEKMWRAYHRLRTAVSFRNDWKVFLHDSISQQACPAFYQHVTSIVFKELMKAEFPLPPPDIAEHPDRPLTFEERNALRFVAGYVCRKVRTKLEVSSIPEKEEMVLCIMSFAGDEEDETEETELWLNTIDRGGLWHVNDTVYAFFAIVEEITRRFFTTHKFSQLQSQDNMKQKMLEHLLHHGDVLFQWCFLTTSVSDSVASLLLERIIQLYVTVRGFGFATSCLEMFKQNMKQSLQRKKALRKHISS